MSANNGNIKKELLELEVYKPQAEDFKIFFADDMTEVKAMLTDGTLIPFASAGGGTPNLQAVMDIGSFAYNLTTNVEIHRKVGDEEAIIRLNPIGAQMSGYNLVTGKTASVSTLDSGAVQLTVLDGANNQSINLAGGLAQGILVTDDIDSKGLVYGADYSANYINRSLVDKEYVNSLNGIYGGNGVIEEERTVSGGVGIAINSIIWDLWDTYNILPADSFNVKNPVGDKIFSIDIGAKSISAKGHINLSEPLVDQQILRFMDEINVHEGVLTNPVLAGNVVWTLPLLTGQLAINSDEIYSLTGSLPLRTYVGATATLSDVVRTLSTLVADLQTTGVLK